MFGGHSEFDDRVDAGRQLGRQLRHLHDSDPVVVGLPRGGVPVAFEVAEALHAPLDVLVVRKLGVPFHPEMAMGAIGEGGARVVDTDLVTRLGLGLQDVAAVEEKERAVLARRLALLRAGRPAIPLEDRTVVIVDDGLATGATARVACRIARNRGAARVVLAVPVGAPDRLRELPEADEVVAVTAPRRFRAVGEHYRHFGPTTDDEVVHLLDEAARLGEIRSLARPLRSAADLEQLVDRARDSRFVCLGEASHGTHEYYQWRAEITRRLIETGDFTWIGVEGDWPDCWRINRWVRGLAEQDLDAVAVLAEFERWPTWMWANRDVADFLAWLRAWNLARPAGERVGFYGLDVYSLWDSLREVITWLEAHAPQALGAAMEAWQCFLPFHEDPHRYAYSTRLVPETCEADVVGLLVEVRRRTLESAAGDEVAFAAGQNAEVAAGAERYYRAMVRGDRTSWNVRDLHMADTIDRLTDHLGPESKGIVWEHNTHVGDARATDMARAGMVNVGQLVRERHHDEGVVLVGFAGHRGTVVAGSGWGEPEEVMQVPLARAGTHEDLLHRALGEPSVLVFGPDRSGPWLSCWLGHRAIGVVYAPERSRGNEVPTRMGARYDALVWFEETRALQPLHHEGRPVEPEYETEPTGF
ncbi:protein-L-isoaspartate O-methyltransferase [Intrasporangium oryzae NRRL B-24470]|uniref:Protein-L-isoaspartate O-methyltransferase n=1 Tax=Intrasporangium oryzae NRRL B-24470 TaxID=1386089 RepID=W9GDY9_9MICO|nr:erythromycin esterase family protein [Intrasporangium oryzae]EWT02069.1 protein-L-isoaspartate O-methyltransferase [Intrasporangium oryzae NRRL B-24470]